MYEEVLLLEVRQDAVQGLLRLQDHDQDLRRHRLQILQRLRDLLHLSLPLRASSGTAEAHARHKPRGSSPTRGRMQSSVAGQGRRRCPWPLSAGTDTGTVRSCRGTLPAQRPP